MLNTCKQPVTDLPVIFFNKDKGWSFWKNLYLLIGSVFIGMALE
ncbi:hypothetical protein GXM_06118 [Nostoc sphaeroides CCNUC1]|uniref:Uncharacterized protein n=1 Tax=Nostoc sphaeroides CCNUC1 TaxID=2653204 RepID=A0A5P8W7I5_9NOSO|nr:hypothetical protein GXM_06118 [Nostoc sphaeroides CCNUC1]